MEEKRSPPDRLERYLGELLGEPLQLLDFERTEGGFSRQAHRAVIRSASQGIHVLALRGEIPVSLLDCNLDREWRLLKALGETPVPLPALYGFEPTGSVLDHRFIVMEWVEGVVPNPWRRSGRELLAELARQGRVGPAWVRDIACLHRVDPQLLRNAGLDAGVDSASYLDRELARWVGKIRNAVRHPGALVEEACGWLEHNRPEPARVTTVVHGDLGIRNMLLRDDHVAAFLDWEMAGLGDWRADIGYCLMPYYAGKLLEPVAPSVGGLMPPGEFLDRYAAATGFSMTDAELVYFITLGCVKMIAIHCGGVDEYVSGRTNDPRLAWLSIPIAGLVDDIDGLLTRGLPWAT
jgi:aminoglycoside phosphotransferase (APT) family kinase protein